MLKQVLLRLLLLDAIRLPGLILLIKSFNDVPELRVVQLHIEINLSVCLPKLLHPLIVEVLQKFDLIKLDEHLELHFVHFGLLVNLLLVLLPDLVHLCLNLVAQVSVVFFLDLQLLLKHLNLLLVLLHLRDEA